jgi:hypothetical protein
MLTYAVIIGMGLAGYWGAPWWLVLAGGVALSLGAWWMKLLQLGLAWSSKSTTYFVTGVALDIALATVAFGAGRIVRAVLAA